MSLDFIFSTQGVLLILKGGYVIAFALYLLFAFVVLAQVKQMTKTIDAGLNGTLVGISKAHLIIAGALLLTAIVVL